MHFNLKIFVKTETEETEALVTVYDDDYTVCVMLPFEQAMQKIKEYMLRSMR